MDPDAAESLTRLMAALGLIFSFSEAQIYALAAVFTRIGAVAALLPGLGERSLPTRFRLVGAIAFTAIVWPVVSVDIGANLDNGGSNAPIGGLSGGTLAPVSLGRLLMAEAVAGLLLGISIRMVLWAMQFAGSIAAQASSVLQILGPGALPDPMPALGALLTIAATALALAAGLHVKAAAAMISSYQVLPFGVFPIAGNLAEWGVARASSAFALAFSLAAPFLILGLVYNIALGAISRAMPQLMVVLVGAPAIVGLSILLLMLAAPLMLTHWSGELDKVLADPFGTPP